MHFNYNLRSILINGFWIFTGLGLVVLLAAAMKGKQEKRCQGMAIELQGEQPGHFLDERDIAALVTDQGKLPVNGQLIQSFDLGQLEAKLRNSVWISAADLYFDNKFLLRVKVKERTPVARIFPVSGNSYYVDALGKHMPLSDKTPFRLPVFTGYPYRYQYNSDSARNLMSRVIGISQHISASPFWQSQVAQIVITNSRQFELIPALGHHVIELGDGNNPAEKFRRLSLFYRQILNKSGMDAYERIRVQYAGQVIGVKASAAKSAYDSSEALRTVARMIEEVHRVQLQNAQADSTGEPEQSHKKSPGSHSTNKITSLTN